MYRKQRPDIWKKERDGVENNKNLWCWLSLFFSTFLPLLRSNVKLVIPFAHGRSPHEMDVSCFLFFNDFASF